MGKVPLQVNKEFELHARQIFVLLIFFAAFDQVISEYNLIMESVGTASKPQPNGSKLKFKRCPS